MLHKLISYQLFQVKARSTVGSMTRYTSSVTPAHHAACIETALPTQPGNEKRQVACRTAPHSTSVIYHDPTTWPRELTATHIEDLLRDNLINPSSPPNYDTLAILHRIHDHKSLELLLPRYVKGRAPPEVDAEDYFTATHAPHAIDTIPLQAQPSCLSALDAVLLPKPGAEVRNIVSCPGGACLLKHFVLMKRLHAMRSGRVIVRSCNFFGHEGPLFPPWLAGIADNQPKNKVLCDLIRTHVASVTGWPQDPRHYRDDPQAAYAMWMSETARYFQISKAPQENMEPLIFLRDCEALANCPHASLVHKSTGDWYSQLEGFCLAVPSPFSIYVDAPINASDPIFLSRANVTHVHLRQLR